MGSSVTIGPAWPMNGPTYNESNLAAIVAGLALPAANQVMSGVFPGGGALSVSAGSGMAVGVNFGSLVVANSSGVTGGGWFGSVNTTSVLTVAASDPVNPRIDLVCATVNDLGTSGSNWELQILAGTPTSGATLGNLTGAPSLPSDSLILAYVLVPATSSSVSSGNIQDERVFTIMQGGIVPVPNLQAGLAALTPYQGLFVYDRSTQRFVRVSTGGAALQPALLPFTPQFASQSGLVASVSAAATICSVSVTTDGSTDIEIHVKWPNLYINNSANFGVYGAIMAILIDGSVVAGVEAPCSTNTSLSGGGGLKFGGGGFMHPTSSGVDRPSNATHTVTFQMQPYGDGTHQVQMLGGSPGPATLYVRPVPL